MEKLSRSEYSTEYLQQLVDRVLNSTYFNRSVRLKEFLRYICLEELSGRGAFLNEQSIGEKVFGRKPGYSPGEDNIVRVSASKLRQRLADYFEGDGLSEEIAIEVPKGAYYCNLPETKAREPIACSRF